MEDTVCEIPAPDWVEFYNTLLSQEPRARCVECHTIWSHWECVCDLEHNCELIKERGGY